MISPTVCKRAKPIALLLILLAGITQLEPISFGSISLEIVKITLLLGLILLACTCFFGGIREKAIVAIPLLFFLCAFSGNAQSEGEGNKAQISPPNYAVKMVRVPQPGALAEFFSYQTITFRSNDNLTVTGNLYEIGPRNPVILLCHQANYNKYEYADIAPRLNALGYNVLAIDQRSGGTLAGYVNETAETAKQMGHSNTGFLDAEQDIIAAIEFLAARYHRQVIVWGSSYSSALAIFVTAHPSVKAALAFSPGNYFRDKKPDLKSFIHQLQKPLFITSSREEAEELIHTIGKSLNGRAQVQFIPQNGGFHGSKAMWENQPGAEEYWAAVFDFLRLIQEF